MALLPTLRPGPRERLVDIPNPEGLEWQGWVDQLFLLNPRIVNRQDPDVPWEEFADYLAGSGLSIPRADFFEDWRAWADALRRGLGR